MTRKRIVIGLALTLLAAGAITLTVLDRDQRVRFKVASVMMDRPSYLDYLLSSWENGPERVKSRVVIVVRRMDETAVDDALEIFQRDESPRAVTAVNVLIEARPEKTSRLLELFKGDNPVLSERVARILRELGAKAVPDLERALDSTDPELKWWAITTLGRMQPPTEITLDALNRIVVNSDSVPLRIAAMRSLAELGAPSAKFVPTLVKVMEHADPELRAGAAEALGIFGPLAQDAAPNLVLALSDDDAIVRRNAWDALHQVR